MENLLPVERHHHIGVVVRDYRRYIEEFSRFFGIERWEVRRQDSSRMPDATLHGKPVKHSFISALGSKGKIAFELCQPVSGDSLYGEFLETHGEGMHHLFPTICSPAEFRRLRPWLESEGITVSQSATVAGTIEYYYLDSTSYFGTTFEVLCPLRPDWQSDSRLKPDEVITIDSKAAGSAGCPTEKIYHACVLTRNKRLSMRDNYQRLMGFEHWFDFDNQTGVTSRDTHYSGKSADTRFRLSLGRKNDFGIEIVEQIYGPTIYQDMLEKQGEGLNHIMTTLCGSEELDLITKRLEADGMPIIQDGQGGDVYYCYADTREKLAGVYVELLCPLSDRFMSDPVTRDLIVGPDL
jgi:Glyoxalase/Bleomycin resistance protein/Dioxygenase superfamily